MRVIASVSYKDPNWCAVALETLHILGYCLVEDVLTEPELEEGRKAVAQVYQKTDQAVKDNRVWQNGVYLERHLPMLYEPHFLKYLEFQPTLAVLDAVIGPHAILRLQTVDCQFGDGPPVPQHHFHQNLKLPFEKCPAMDVSYFFEPLDGSSTTIEIVPGSHRGDVTVSKETLAALSVPLECPAGTMLISEPRLLHRERPRQVGTRLLFTFAQFVPHYVKSFFDYPRALGEAYRQNLSERLLQILGWNSRIPTNLDEFYVPAEQRLYKAGQW
jgi:ectoine hydroxylase-related dioxygenase (phytanoyl-CoA dioxygenase family)